MGLIDWLIVIIPVVFVLGLGLYSRKYIRGVADYLAAGRVCGRGGSNNSGANPLRRPVPGWEVAEVAHRYDLVPRADGVQSFCNRRGQRHDGWPASRGVGSRWCGVADAYEAPRDQRGKRSEREHQHNR